jgi:RNA polymerase sigma-70 factor (sigma-E family)
VDSGRDEEVTVQTSDPPKAATDAGAAVTALYREHAVGLGRAALLLVGDRPSAEDVVQEAFFGLHRRWLRDGTPRDPVAYIRTAVFNGCRSVLRRRALRIRLPDAPPVWSAESAVVLDEDRRAVLEAITRLPRRQREVLVLKFYLDLPETEIASALGVSRGTVSSTASRALTALAGLLGEEF